MDKVFGTTIRSTTPDKKSITDPKQTSDYVWYAIERRVLSYLEQQKEVDKTRLGAKCKHRRESAVLIGADSQA